MATPRNQSVFKAFAMLKAFRNADEWLTSSELSRRSNLPEASGYRLIQTLEEIGAVTRGRSGRYRLGLLIAALSQNVIVPSLLRDVGQMIAADVSRKLNATVHVGVLERGMLTYVLRAATPTSFPAQTRAGAQQEAYCSGLGKVLLAGLPSGQLDAVLDDDLVALTPNTITDKAQLRLELAEVSRRGFAVDNGEFVANMACVAVPIRDHQGCTVAAMSASESVANMTAARQDELRRDLALAAAELSAKAFPSGPATFTRARAQRRPNLRPANGNGYEIEFKEPA